MSLLSTPLDPQKRRFLLFFLSVVFPALRPAKRLHRGDFNCSEVSFHFLFFGFPSLAKSRATTTR